MGISMPECNLWLYYLQVIDVGKSGWPVAILRRPEHSQPASRALGFPGDAADLSIRGRWVGLHRCAAPLNQTYIESDVLQSHKQAERFSSPVKVTCYSLYLNGLMNSETQGHGGAWLAEIGWRALAGGP
jgi:hypothetical protein